MVRDLFSLQYFDNNDFKQFHTLCVDSRTTAKLAPSGTIKSSTLLHFACIYSNLKIVTECIGMGADVNAVDDLGCTPLYYSICSQEIKIVEYLLDNGADIRINPTNIITNFEMSLRLENKNITDMLIEKMESLEDWPDATPLQVAVGLQNGEVAQTLITSGGNINITDRYGNTPLHIAVLNNNQEMVRLLLQHRADVNARNKERETPLFLAVKKHIVYKSNYIPIINVLLTRKISVSVTIDDNGRAEKKAKTEISFINKIEIDLESLNDSTPLYYAISNNGIEVVEILLRNGANVNYVDKNGLAALEVHIKQAEIKLKNKLMYMYIRMEAKHLKMVKILLHYGVDSEYVTRFGLTLLLRAARAGDTELVQLLLDKGVNPNRHSKDDITPLYMAILTQNSSVIKCLLKQQTQLNIETSINTLVSKAKQMGNIENVLVLLHYWATRPEDSMDVSTYSNEVTNLIKRIEDEATLYLINENLNRKGNDIELARALLKLSVVVSPENALGIKCLKAVLELNNKDVDQILLNYIKEMYTLPDSRQIGFPAFLKNEIMIRILLRNGRNVNSLTPTGRSLLTHAIFYNWQKSVEILLENQADVNLPDTHGDTPLSIAERLNNSDIVQMLLEKRAYAKSSPR